MRRLIIASLAALATATAIAQTVAVTGSLTINGVSVPFTGTIPAPPVGPQGATGPAGPIGPMGPAGNSVATTIPPSTSLVDGANNVWTVVNGVVKVAASGKAAVNAGVSSNVVGLALVNGVVYQENTACLWWSWNGTTWIGSTAPAGVSVTACPAK